MPLARSILLSLLLSTTTIVSGQINDCSEAEVICSDADLEFNPVGPGLDDYADPDNDEGCIHALEQNSAWYYFEINPAAPPNLEIGFIIHPDGGLGEDFDWALYGPDVNCGELGSPIRCSSSTWSCGFCPETGMGMGTTDVSEGPGIGDGFVSTLIVQPGQGYFLMIDNFYGTDQGFSMEWTGSAAPYLNCDAEAPCSVNANAGSYIEACDGQVLQLIGGGSADTYSWEGDNGGTAFLNNPEIRNPILTIPDGFTGEVLFTLSITEDTCSSQAQVLLIVEPGPDVSITPIGPFCVTDSPQYLIGDPEGGVWSGAVSNSTFNPGLLGPGLHTVSYTYGNPICTLVVETVVEVFDIPSVTIDPNPASFCDSENSILLTASGSDGAGDYNYTWTTPSEMADGEIYDAEYSGLYTVVVTDENGCTNSGTTTVTNFENPNITFVDPGPICNSLPDFTLHALPAGGQFEGNIITPSGLIHPNMLAPGAYNVSYTFIDTHNCESTETIQFLIASPPSSIATNNGPVCLNQTILLFGETNASSGNNTYHWSGPNGYSSDVQNPVDAIEAGLYQLVITSDGCPSAVDTTIVTQISSLQPVIAGQDTLCIGFSSTLDAGNGYAQYVWSDASTQQTLEVTTSGVYSVTVVDVNGCKGADTVTVAIQAGLSPIISGSLSFCEGSTTMLDAGSGYAHYQWSTGEDTPFISVATGANVGVTVTDADGCSGSTAVTTTVNPNPVVLIGGSTTFCIGGSSTLDAGQGFAVYEWSTGSPNQSITVNTPGIYGLEVTDINGCKGSSSVVITESTSLSPVITGTPAYCKGGSTLLNAGSFATYLWSDGSMNQTLSVNAEATYTVTVSDGQGCSGSSSVPVIEVIPPFSTVNTDVTICNTSSGGSILNLYDQVIAGDLNGFWSDDDQSGASGLFDQLDFNEISAGIYQFSYTTNSAASPCLENTYLLSVTVVDCSCPEVIIQNSSDLCNDNSTLDLSALIQTTEAGSWSIASSPPGTTPAVLTGAMLNATDANAGLYGLQFVLADQQPPGCPSSFEIMLQVDLQVSAGIAIGQPIVCEKDHRIFNLNTLLSGQDANGIWSETSLIPSQFNAFYAPLGIFTTDVQLAGTYSFEYKVVSGNACPDVATEVNVIINPLPLVIISDPDMLDCNHLSTSLNANGSSNGTDFDIDWTGPGILPNGSEHSLHPSVDKAGTYTLSITNLQTGCSDQETVNVTSNSNLLTSALIDAKDPACYGLQNGSIHVNQVIGGTPLYNFSLNHESHTLSPDFVNLPAGEYLLQIEDAAGCRWDTLITLSDPEAFSLDLGPDLEAGLGELVTILAITNLSADQMDTMIWSPDDGIQCIDVECLEATLLPSQSFILEATLTDTAGCETKDEVWIKLDKQRKIYLSNAFSPNGDGINDLFMIFAANGQVDEIKSFTVFSRWGEVVYDLSHFQPNDPLSGWDGQYAGQLVNPGVYVYKVEVKFIDNVVETYSGSVTILK